MSASIVFAQQSVGGGHQIPTFNRKTSGIIFRPHAAKILCGKAVDSAGTCGGNWCSSARLRMKWSEASDKLCVWRRADIGLQLKRLNEYGKTRNWLEYNEVIVSAPWWVDHVTTCRVLKPWSLAPL